MRQNDKFIKYISPMLAKEIAKPFNDEEWIFEIKWDGYRAIAEVNGNDVKLYSRNGISLNNTFPIIADELIKMNFNAVLDGEVVALNKKGGASFQLLQDYQKGYPLVYYVFDALYIDKKNICSQPLLERKKQLRKIIKKSDVVKYSDHIHEKGIDFFKLALKNNLEGIMAKRINSLYLPGKRTSDWLKIKHQKTMDAIIVGFTKPKGGRGYFGSLVLAVLEKGKLIHIGQTGTGFNVKSLKNIYEVLKPLITKEQPFDQPIAPDISFTPVKPILVCEVRYTEITKEGKLRHPVFLHLRTDKKANEVGRLK